MTKDLTSGNITPILVKFTVPMVLGNIYNAVDSLYTKENPHSSAW